MLNPGAEGDRIQELEDAIGLSLPMDVIESLERHDGQSTEANCAFLFGQLVLADCETIHQEQSTWQSYDDGEPLEHHTCYPKEAIENRYYSSFWIPVAGEADGTNWLAIDLSPGKAGSDEQVIDYGADVYDRGVLAPSWGDFLLSYAIFLESGILEEFSQDPDEWSVAFESVWERACLDALVLWSMDGRWPMVEIRPEWRSPAVLGLAESVAASRDFSLMPKLADALEQAGCESPGLLRHCRDRNCTHTRGCWAIDALLGIRQKDRWCHKFEDANWPEN